MANVAKPHKDKNGSKAVNYVLGKKGGRGHNGHDHRNELIYMRNMHRGESVIKQMQTHWDLASEQHTNQCVTMIFGFSESEIPSANEDSPYLAMTVVNDYMDDLEKRGILPRGHQCLLAVQKDGKSGLIHCHAVFNDVNSVTHRGLPKEMNWGPILTKDFQKYCEKAQLFQVDYGTDPSREHDGENYTRVEQALREQGKPVFKDIVRSRILEAVGKSDNYGSFTKELKNLGITIDERTTKKGAISYKYVVDPDTLGGYTTKTGNYSLRSTSLGPKYSPKAIESGFEHQEEATKSDSLLSMKEFMEQTGDIWWEDGRDGVEAFRLIQEAYEEYKKTKKLPTNDSEDVTNTPEVSENPVQDEQVVMPVIGSDDEESEKKKGRKATRSSKATVESIETVEKQNVAKDTVKSRYAKYDSAVKHDMDAQNNAMIAAVMRKAESVPDAEQDKDRYFGE